MRNGRCAPGSFVPIPTTSGGNWNAEAKPAMKRRSWKSPCTTEIDEWCWQCFNARRMRPIEAGGSPVFACCHRQPTVSLEDGQRC